MSRIKEERQVLGHRTKAELAARKRDQNPDFSLGLPPRPPGLDRTTRNLWNKRAGQLLRNRVLARTDGPVLMRLVEADLVGDKELANDIIRTTWMNREPFPEPQAIEEAAAPAPGEAGVQSLDDFLSGVRAERDSFPARMQPGTTVCLDSTGLPYQWPEGDPAEVARRYALEITQGNRVAGELVRRACDRFLKDLEQGHERGLYFDPVAARHICEFAEQFCGLRLIAWQTFVLANVFGWKKPSGARRFTEAWVSCAKKNGKTRLASTVALWGLVADQEKYPDVFSAATKKDQSRLVWRDAKRAVQDNEFLRDHVKCWSGALQISDTDGMFTPLSSEEKSMDGLRPSTIIADEVAFWGDREQWDKLSKGVVSRVQPVVFAVTTAGSTKHCFAFGKFDLGEKILRGIYNDDSTFVAIFSIDKTDNPLNEQCWPKSNPSLGVTLQAEHLRKTRDEVLQDASGMNAWLQYHCNIWPEVSLTRQGSIPAPKWDACTQRDLIGATSPMEATLKFLELNADTPVFLGVDVGLTSDTTAVAMLWPRARFVKDGPMLEKRVAIIQVFIPEIGLLEKEKQWGVPLSQFAREGWVELMPGDITDVRVIKKYVVDLHLKFAIREVGYDPWQFSVAAAELNESGVACVEVPQVPSQLTAPARELISSVHNQDLVHFGNPVLSWMANNVVLVESEKHSGVKPEKLSPAEKIDGISAIVNAWHRMLAAPPPSVYLERGIPFI